MYNILEIKERGDNMFVELKNNETVQDYLQPGKVAVIKFATTTCPPCKMLKPILKIRKRRSRNGRCDLYCS